MRQCWPFSKLIRRPGRRDTGPCSKRWHSSALPRCMDTNLYFFSVSLYQCGREKASAKIELMDNSLPIMITRCALYLLLCILYQFSDSMHGEWYGYLTRDWTVNQSFKGGPYKGCFHVPRCLLYCLQCLKELRGNPHD